MDSLSILTTNSSLPSDDSLEQTYSILSAIGAASHQEQLERQEEFDQAWSSAGRDSLYSSPLRDCGSCNCTDSSCGIAVEAPKKSQRFTGPSMVGIPDTSPLRNAPLLSQLMGIPPPPPLQRVNAFTTAELSSDMSPAARFQPINPVSEDEVAHTLRTYRVQLHMERQELFENVNTQEELDAADRKYDVITKKINAIESAMLAIGAIFRTF